MNWDQAVQLARMGHIMRRKSEMVERVIDEGNPDSMTGNWRDDAEHAPVIESGQEGFRLMHAWTDTEAPVLVFVGEGSKCLFVPDDEQRGATDWVIER